MRPSWRVAVLALCWVLLAWAAFVPLRREVSIDRHTWRIDATVTAVHRGPAHLLFGRRGTVDVYYEPGNREARATVPRYGFAAGPGKGETVHIEYDVYHPNRARLAGDHGDGVAAAVAAVLWAAVTVLLVRALRPRRRLWRDTR